MFSKTYLKQPAGSNQDSERLRNRLAAKSWELTGQNEYVRATFARLVEVESGSRLPYGPGGPDVGRFFRETQEFRDVLDAVSCMTLAFHQEGRERDSEAWVNFCRRAFGEEGMAYRIDERGDAHYVIDVAFHEMADAVIATLAGGRYAAAGVCANKAVEQMTKAQPDGKHAIRDIFEGVETAFKVVAGTNRDLTQANIAAELTPLVNRRFPDGEPVAKGAAAQTLESLKDWTNACHKYRHGHGAEEPVEPPLDLAIVLVGNGLNFARWIASLVA
jgi:hypothetical protein